MFGRDDSIADGSHIDAPIQFSPQAIQKAAVCSETFLIGIQIMLEVFRKAVLISLLTFCLADTIFRKQFHRDIQRLGKLVNRFSGAFVQMGFPAADIIQRGMRDSGLNSKAIFRHAAQTEKIVNDHMEHLHVDYIGIPK